MTAPHRRTYRQSLRSALSHKSLADEILDSLNSTQTKLNSTLDKLDADSAVALDVDYESTGAITDSWEADAEGSGSAHKSTLRKSLRSALAHRKLADEIADSIEELQTAYNAMLVKLDAEAGTLNDTDYNSSLRLGLTSFNVAGTDAQHKSTFRNSLKKALAHSDLANAIADAVRDTQASFNRTLVLLDAGTVGGTDHADNQVTVIDPDAA